MIWIAVAYLCGSIPFGLIIARAASGKDVRTVGSGNIGATNVARAAGRPAAIATLALDAVKGLAPVLLAPREFAPACAVAAVLGHCFPVWLRFRGGKGVATGLGVSLALAPWAAVAGGVTWVVLYKILKISSIGSLAGVAVSLAVAAFPELRRLLADIDHRLKDNPHDPVGLTERGALRLNNGELIPAIADLRTATGAPVVNPPAVSAPATATGAATGSTVINTPNPPGTFDTTPATCASRKMPRKRMKVSGSWSGRRM